jgi:transcriptional regulator with GAF, ATPase, and Fis domain
LDEIGDIGASMQAKLLRVLQEYEIKRVGGQDWIRVDVRVVAATNRNLQQLVEGGTFREDLFYRLKVVTITLPPLRDRREDIPLLAEYFVRRYGARSGKSIAHLTPEAMALLTEHPWPGNIRELEHCIERAVALASGQVLTPEDLAPELKASVDSALFRGAPTLEEVKRRYLAHVLQETGGNISRAAGILGVERRSLQRMLRRYGLRTS